MSKITQTTLEARARTHSARLAAGNALLWNVSSESPLNPGDEAFIRDIKGLTVLVQALTLESSQRLDRS
jgi:membrane protein implicated in regulation of membrane protease activity